MASRWSQVMAGAVLSKAAALRPSAVPNDITDDVIAEWAECLDLIEAPRVNEMWAEAVRDWALNEPNDRMFTPWSLKQAVMRVRRRWDQDPEKAKALNAWRYRRRESSLRASGLSGEVAEGVLGQLRQSMNVPYPATVPHALAHGAT